ncbi:MAG TPA: hypothetical protein VHO91_15410 [Rhodopila sp.]|nr:hypothetical protein [Rhodopila sp.]
MLRVELLASTGLAGAALLRQRYRASDARTPDARTPNRQPVSDAIAPSETRQMDVAEVTRNFLLGFVLPLWLTACVADYACHRATNIAVTTGPKESLMHLLMLTEAAIPTMAGLFLEITSPVLALMLASFLLHDVTALWDVSYAVKLREVTPIEQHVHSYLEMVPLMAAAFVSVLHWPQMLALFGIGARRPDWSVRWKRQKLPWRATVPLLGCMVLLEWLPYLEELARTIAARPERQKSLAAMKA